MALAWSFQIRSAQPRTSPIDGREARKRREPSSGGSTRPNACATSYCSRRPNSLVQFSAMSWGMRAHAQPWRSMRLDVMQPERDRSFSPRTRPARRLVSPDALGACFPGGCGFSMRRCIDKPLVGRFGSTEPHLRFGGRCWMPGEPFAAGLRQRTRWISALHCVSKRFRRALGPRFFGRSRTLGRRLGMPTTFGAGLNRAPA
jgi:hypothetical protein